MQVRCLQGGHASAKRGYPKQPRCLHSEIRKAVCFQPPHKVEVLPFLNSCFLLFPFSLVTGTFYRMLVLSHQDKTFGKEGFLGRLALAAVEQTNCPIIIHCVFRHTGNRLFQNLLNRFYRLSPSAKVYSGIPGAVFFSDCCRFAQIRSVAAWSAYFLPVDWI